MSSDSSANTEGTEIIKNKANKDKIIPNRTN